MRKGIKDRQAAKEALLKRTKEAYDRKDDSGFYGSCFKQIEGLNHWKCKEGKHEIDVIPFLAGSNMPVKMNTKEGEEAHMLDIFIHKNVGVNDDDVVCLAIGYKQPCPVCEYRKKLTLGDGDEDLIKDLRPRHRNIFNIICYDSDEEEDKGVQVWEVAHWFMGKYLAPLSEAPRSGGHIAYSHPDKELGKTVVFERKGTKETDFLAHRFIDREYDISDEILEQAFCLDEIIVILSYEEIHSMLWAGSKDENLVEPTAQQEPSRRPRARDRQTQQEEPPPGNEEEQAVNPCPAGGQFGVDIDSLEQCHDCSEWDECAKESDRLEEEKKESTSTPAKRERKETTPTPSRRAKKEEPNPPRKRGLIRRNSR